MKRMLPSKIVLLFCCCCCASLLLAQKDANDNTGNIAIEHAVNAYHHLLAPETNLYKGSEYVAYPYTFNEGIPFFITSEFSSGTVEYNGVLYRNVPLLYDEIKDELIIRDFYARGKIRLNTENITGFSLQQHQFVRLAPDSAAKSPIRTGFYEVLYGGNLSVYKKEVKRVLESVNLTGVTRTVSEYHSFFIKKGNVYYTVASKKALLNILKDKRKDLQQFIKSNRLNIRKEKETALVKIAAHYDQLTNR